MARGCIVATSRLVRILSGRLAHTWDPPAAAAPASHASLGPWEKPRHPCCSCTAVRTSAPRAGPAGRSRGFGFVAMSTEAEVDEVIDALDGREWDGRKLLVERARNVRT